MKKKFRDIKDILEIRYNKSRYIRTSELLFLQSLVKTLPKNSKVLEIGSFIGKSSVCIAEALEEIQGTLDCIDNISETWFPNQKAVLTNNTKDYKNISLIFSSSSDFFKNNQLIYDLIFIDGDHHIDCFLSDLMYSIKFADKILCGHDFTIISPWIIHIIQAICEDFDCSYSVTGYVWNIEKFHNLKNIKSEQYINHLKNKIFSNKIYFLNNNWYKNE